MNRILGIITVGLFFLASNAQAHCGKCGMEDAPKADAAAMAREKTDKMSEELGLNEDQKGKLQEILKEKIAKKQQIMDEKHIALDALHEEFKAKLGGILTAEQMTKWEEMKSQHEEMDGKCPMCKDGKMCKMCLLKKGKASTNIKKAKNKRNK